MTWPRTTEDVEDAPLVKMWLRQAPESTFGALPRREAEFRSYDEQRQRSFAADRTPRVVRHEGEKNQAVVRLIWPTRDGEDFTESLELEMLARVLRLQLTDKLRESKEELFNLRFQMATGQLDNNRRLRTVRQEIARIYTVLRERELGLASGPDGEDS